MVLHPSLGRVSIHPMSAPATNVRVVSRLQLLLTVWTGRVTIDILPDDVLILVFRFDQVVYLEGLKYHDRLHNPSWKWHRLVHVCRRWRSVIFASPNSLDVRLICGPHTSMERMDIWPPLPVIIRNVMFVPMPEDHGFDAAIVHHNRVHEIELFITGPEWQRLAVALQEHFSALIHLNLLFVYIDSRHPTPVLPDRLLGGSAPRLQSLKLHTISFPTLPKFLLSATHLVRLDLLAIPHSGYMSPEALVAGLAVSPNLKLLRIIFDSPRGLPNREIRHPPPPTRTVLPSLTHFELKGVSEWLEDVLGRIDAPLLDSLYITFFHQFIFDTLPLARFMSRTAMFEALNEAHLVIGYDSVQVKSLYRMKDFDNRSGLGISCEEMNHQITFLVQVVKSLFPSIYVVESLYIYGAEYSITQWRDDNGDTQWVDIFRPFTAVKNLYMGKEFARRIAPALQELVGGKARDVLPALKNLWVEDWGIESSLAGPTQEAIGRFVAARQLLGQPVALQVF